MRTGLTKKEKVTELYTDESIDYISLVTHNAKLKKALLDMALDIEQFVYEVEKKAERQQKISLYQRTKDQYYAEIEKLKKH